MPNLRCIIADIPQKMLSDIVFKITHGHENIEVVDQLSDSRDLFSILNKQTIDVLILGGHQQGFQDYCRELLNKFKDILIVGLINDGRQAVVYLDDVRSQEIVKIIHALGRR